MPGQYSHRIIRFIALAAGIGGQQSGQQIHRTHREGCSNRGAGLDEAAINRGEPEALAELAKVGRGGKSL
jgi:hypothetical protein